MKNIHKITIKNYNYDDDDYEYDDDNNDDDFYEMD